MLTSNSASFCSVSCIKFCNFHLKSDSSSGGSVLMKSATCRTYLPQGSINWSMASLLCRPASIAASRSTLLLSKAASAASKLRHVSLPLFLFFDLGAGPAGEVGDEGMVEGGVGTGVKVSGGGGCGVGVSRAGTFDGDTSTELPSSVILLVGNWELTWDEVWVTWVNDGPSSGFESISSKANNNKKVL